MFPLRETLLFITVKQNAANQESPKENLYKHLEYFILCEVFTLCSPSFG